MATETALALREHRRSRFFPGMSLLLLAITVVGFIPTLFMRPWFGLPPMEPRLYAHGFVLTGWFTLLAVQASLVHLGRVDLHRRVGIATACFALAVLFLSMTVVLLKASRLQASGVDLEARIAPDSGIFWTNIGSILIFAAFVILAVLLRGRPEAHKRLLLLASINFIGPPLGRLPRWPVFGGEDYVTRVGISEAVVPMAGTLALLLVVVAYDLLVVRRLHPATWMGCLTIVVVRVASIALALSPFGRAVVRATASMFAA